MSGVLLLTLAGPLQAWGDSSRFERRATRPEPTKSGVLGLVAAAQGRPRDSDLSDLGLLRFGVRADQEGTLLRDFQTAKHPKWTNPKLSYRFYLQDAVFVAALEGEHTLLEGIRQSILNPSFPLYLGRRACPPARPLVLGVVDGTIESALEEVTWQAAEWYQRRQPADVRLRAVRDATSDEVQSGRRGESVRDVPVSFSPERREYHWRDVVEWYLEPPGRSAYPDADGRSARNGNAHPAPLPTANEVPMRPSGIDPFDDLAWEG